MAPLNKKITKKASGATRNRTGDTRPRIFSDQSFALPIHIKVFNIPKNNSLYKVFITQKRESFRRTTLFTWCHQESNRGHKDFQSFALPTELWHHYNLCLTRREALFAGAKVTFYFGSCKYFSNFLSKKQKKDILLGLFILFSYLCMRF